MIDQQDTPTPAEEEAWRELEQRQGKPDHIPDATKMVEDAVTHGVGVTFSGRRVPPDDLFLPIAQAEPVILSNSTVSDQPSGNAGELPETLVTLTGAQLLRALDFIAPDRETDPQQLENEVSISHGEGHSGTGYYAYLTDYPDEGAVLLDAEAPAAQAQPPVSQSITDERTEFVDWFRQNNMPEYQRSGAWAGWQARAALAQAPRACTCHPDDRPDGPCRERYAASECQALAATEADRQRRGEPMRSVGTSCATGRGSGPATGIRPTGTNSSTSSRSTAMPTGTIEITEYVRPHGRREVRTLTDLPADLVAWFRDHNVTLGVEHLGDATGMVAFYVTLVGRGDPNTGEDAESITFFSGPTLMCSSHAEVLERIKKDVQVMLDFLAGKGPGDEGAAGEPAALAPDSEDDFLAGTQPQQCGLLGDDDVCESCQ